MTLTTRTARLCAVLLLAALVAGLLTAIVAGGASQAAAPTPMSKGGGSISSTDPNSPFVLGAAEVATRSRTQVQELHAMAVATTKRHGFDHAKIPGIGQLVASGLAAEIKDATMAIPPKGTPAAHLVAALRAYRRQAVTLSHWNAKAGKPLPASYFARLAETDRHWKSALKALSKLVGKNLLAKLPPLAMP